MSATCVPWYVPRGNTGLSKHGKPVFPRLCPVNQNLACVRTRGGGAIPIMPYTLLSLSAYSLLCMHAGQPMGMAVSPCISWFQTQLILTACQMCYHSHLWDHRRSGQL